MRKFVVGLALLVSACTSLSTASENHYPQDWWKEVPRSEAAGWEILPQDAKYPDVILSKRTELGVFSNFAATPFTYRGVKYGSVEGFWQMMKYPEGSADERNNGTVKWEHTREEVGLMTAFDAKAAGNKANDNMKKLKISWVTFEGKKINYLERSKGDFYKLIFDAEMAKMDQNPDVRKLLLQTGNLRLLPDHQQSTDSAPAWKYYDIWMEIREKIK